MPNPKQPAPTYDTLKTELDTIMVELQREDLDVDRAIEYYRRGLELAGQLERYLATAENTITELKAGLAKIKPAPK